MEKLTTIKERNTAKCSQDQEMRKSSGRGGLWEGMGAGTVAARLMGSPASGSSAGVVDGSAAGSGAALAIPRGTRLRCGGRSEFSSKRLIVCVCLDAKVLA